MRSRWPSLAALLLLAVVGCDREPIALEDFPARYEAAKCRRDARCNLVPDAKACDEAITTTRQTTAGVLAGRIAYDPEAAARCVEGIDDLDCRNVSPLLYLEACRASFVGQVEDGGACLGAIECASSRCDLPKDCQDACCVGTCQPLRQAGEPCGSSWQCAEDLLCMTAEPLGDTLVCHPPLVEGEICGDYARDCAIGLYCDTVSSPVYADGVDPGVCRPQARRGQPCDPAHAVFSCSSIDDFCSPDTRVCTARGGHGDVCLRISEPGLSGQYDSCAYDTHCVGDRCVGDQPAGSPCESEADCAGPLTCNLDTGTCAVAELGPICPGP